MSVYLAYATVIVIWATTPLAIKLSNDSLLPMASVSLRFMLAVAIALPVCWLLKRGPFLNIRHCKLYFFSALGIFPNMPLIYFAVQYIPSGLVAVLFGLTPFITGLLAKPLLGENLLTREKLLALLLACVGLVVIFREQVAVNEQALLGLSLMALSAIIFSLSNVLVRRITQQMTASGETLNSFQQVCGSMVFALPGLLLCWLASDRSMLSGLPEFSATSLWSLLYLSVMASLVGFVAYFRVLTTMSMGLVSLIPLITPVLAMLLGALLAGESVSANALLGCAIILTGLGWYQGLQKSVQRLLRQLLNGRFLSP